jgi:hypothetical protein
MNLVTIAVLSSGAAVGLFVLSGLAIRILLGGDAFDEEDIVRTTSILAVFAIAVPLESLTHLLSRALYATRNTILPTLASVVGFVAIVLAADRLAPTIGLAAIPVGFAVGMAAKVAVLALTLAPRVARMGRAPEPARRMDEERRVWQIPRASLARRRLAPLAITVALAALAVGVVHSTGEALSGATLGVAPLVTPWARVNPPVNAGSPIPSAAGPGGPVRSGEPAASASPTPRPGPFSMDLYERGDFVGEFRDIWCLPAAMQTAMNIMDVGADTSRTTQGRLFDLTRSLAPAPDGAAEPEAWAMGLAQLGYGEYEVRAQPSIKSAIQVAAKQIRLTNRPAGLMVWRGAHTWTMSGFTATADPAATDAFTVTAVRIEDVWYPRFSKLWGYSRKPDALVPVATLPEDFLPWHRPRGSYPAKEGKFVIIVPT